MINDIVIKVLENTDCDIWDEFVKRSPQGTIFNTSTWLKSISKILNKELRLYGVYNKDSLVGGCALFFQKKAFFKFAYSPLPGTATPYGGIILRQEQTKNITSIESVTNSLLNYFNSEGIDRIFLINSPDLKDIRPFTWKGWFERVRYTYILNLNEDLWTNIESRSRRTIKKAMKNSVTIKTSTDTQKFYKLFELTYSSQNLPVPVPKDFITHLFNELSKKDQCKLWVAETETGELAASAIFVWDEKRAYGWVGASHPLHRKVGAPSLLYWSIFDELSQSFTELDLCGANTPNIVKFKESFNPILVPYFRLDYSSKRFKLFKKVKQLLPIHEFKQRIKIG